MMRRKGTAGAQLGSALAWALLCAARPPVDFIPTANHLSAPTEEYKQIWVRDGARMIATLESLVGLPFPDNRIDIIVTQSRPMMAFDGRSMRVRASYTIAYKKATLVHEMGHRLAFLLPRDGTLDEHQLLYLFLYDAWTDLYGPVFADRMVAIERRNRRVYDYDAAWTWALSMSREERQAQIRSLRNMALDNQSGSSLSGR